MAIEKTTNRGFYAFNASILGITQNLGVQEINVKDSIPLRNFSLQFDVKGSPSAGTATVSIKTYGAATFADLSTTVDLTSSTLLVSFEALTEEIKITPNNFDGDSFDVYIAAV